MKKEGVIVSTFTIQRLRQVELFQVNIPREAANIIGIELGCRWISGVIPALPVLPPSPIPFTFNRNLVIGEVQLQSYEVANQFYSGELTLNRNHDYANFTNSGFAPKPYTHRQKAHEEEVKVNGNTTILKGVYRDKAADHIEGNYQYQVKIYVWAETFEQ